MFYDRAMGLIIKRCMKFFMKAIGWLARKYGNPQLVFSNNSSPVNHELSRRIIQKKWTVILQGPLPNPSSIKYLDRVLDSYRLMVNKPEVILSSYANQAEIPRELLSKFDHVIYSDLSQIEHNLHGQLVTTSAGIRAAQDADYILKARVDQILENPMSLTLAQIMLENYPALSPRTGSRLLGSSMNSWLYRPLGLSDMWVAGAAEDMSHYWALDSNSYSQGQKVSMSEIDIQFEGTWTENYKTVNENWLATRYALLNGQTLTADWWHDSITFWTTSAVVLDALSLGIKWQKRDTYIYGNKEVMMFNGSNPLCSLEISFSTWQELSSMYTTCSKTLTDGENPHLIFRNGPMSSF